MDDLRIIELYNERNEDAISETGNKYGSLLYRIAINILSRHEDSEEVVNDTYAKAWNSIPPEKPNILSAYLGKITRNLSINRWHSRTSQKRGGGMELLLSELEDCIPSQENVEKGFESNDLVQAIDSWLGTLTINDRVLFLRRYWYCDAVNTLAKECGTSPNKLAGKLYRLRQDLKKVLESEGITL